MKRCCLWLCTLTAAGAAAISDAHAFNLHGPGVRGIAHLVAGPELHGPGSGAPAAGPIKPPAPPSGNYNFSGNSFNLSVTRNGHPPGPPPPMPRGPSAGGGRPGFFERMFNWW